MRIIALMAVVASLTTLYAPVSPVHSPYVSALSDLVATPAFAAGCPNKACNRGIDCFAMTGYKCIHFNGKGCTATAC